MRGAWAALVLLGLVHSGGCLKCLECYGLPYNCVESVRECYALQTSCIVKAYTYQNASGTTDMMWKGCSQGLSCNESAYVNTGDTAVYISNTCCMKDLCNSGTYYARAVVSQMSCQSCLGTRDQCSPSIQTTMSCAGVQNLCMSITTLTYNQSVLSMDTAVKACGTGPLCGMKLHYNTGNTTLYSQVDCCGNDTNCNKVLPTVTPNTTLNGLQCYACNETGKNECNATRIGKVNCTGQMNSCLDVVGFSTGKTLMRGCCSQDVCLGLTTSFPISVSQKLYCCTGNFCNNGNTASYFSSLACRLSVTVAWMLLLAIALRWAL